MKALKILAFYAYIIIGLNFVSTAFFVWSHLRSHDDVDDDDDCDGDG